MILSSIINLLPTTYYLPPTRRGQAVLSLVFTIGGIVIMVGLTLAFIATSLINSTYSFQVSERAEAAAMSGVYNALLRLNRNNTLAMSAVSVPVGSNSATVTVTQDPSGIATITSSATVSGRTRIFKVLASIAPNTGQVAVVSWQSQ